MENFNEIINGKQLTLVDFFATWCGHLQDDAPSIGTVEGKLRRQYSNP